MHIVGDSTVVARSWGEWMCDGYGASVLGDDVLELDDGMALWMY